MNVLKMEEDKLDNMLSWDLLLEVFFMNNVPNEQINILLLFFVDFEFCLIVHPVIPNKLIDNIDPDKLEEVCETPLQYRPLSAVIVDIAG